MPSRDRPPAPPTSTTTERLGGSARIQLADPTLVLLNPEQLGQSVSVTGPDFLVGSGEDVQLRLAGRGVSRHHFEIRSHEGNYLLIDRGSTNGTLLNGTAVLQAFLHPGDRIGVGTVELTFEGRQRDADVSAAQRDHLGGLYGTSIGMRRLFTMIDRVAPSETTVLVTGETGTGKDLVARAIHQGSPRSGKPFLILDCSAVSGDLMSSELFGHMEGAFTGANRRHEGVFEAASGGTVFLDEIGELPLDLQPKLLRVLENKEVKPIGSPRAIPVDARVLAATHRDLTAMVNAGKFRQDLYYRLAVLCLHLPPLRERVDDIPGLVERLLRASKHPRRTATMSPEALGCLSARPWIGNVRELRNVLERAVTMATGSVINATDLGLPDPADALEENLPAQSEVQSEKGDRLAVMEIDLIRNVLIETGGNQRLAAQKLGIHRDTLRAKVQRYGLLVPKFVASTKKQE